MSIGSAKIRYETPVRRLSKMAIDSWTAAVVLLWIPTILWCDRFATGRQQLFLGIATWSLLAGALRWQMPIVRIQAAVVVGFATVVEYSFSTGLHVYDYRLGHVPAYVPPGHGLVYLGALSLGHLVGRTSRPSRYVAAVVILGAGYSTWGLVGTSRQDVLGAFWYLCLLAFLAFGRSRLLYLGAFVVVSYLEIIGTRWGVWTWAPRDPTGLVAIGNPPSGAAGGYGWFDLAAVFAAARLAPWLDIDTVGSPRFPLLSSTSRRKPPVASG